MCVMRLSLPLTLPRVPGPRGWMSQRPSVLKTFWVIFFPYIHVVLFQGSHMPGNHSKLSYSPSLFFPDQNSFWGVEKIARAAHTENLVSVPSTHNGGLQKSENLVPGSQIPSSLFINTQAGKHACVFWFLRQISLHSLGWPRIHCEDQAGLKLRSTSLCLPSAGTESVCHNTQLKVFFFFF